MENKLNDCESIGYRNRSTINSTNCQHNEFKKFSIRMVLDNALENVRTLRSLPQKSTFMPENLTENLFHWTANKVLTGGRRSTATDLTLILRATTETDIYQHKKSIDLQNIENLLNSIRFDAKEALSKLRECERVFILSDQAKNLNKEYKKRHNKLKETLRMYELNAITGKQNMSVGGQLTKQYLVINPIKDRYFLLHHFTHQDMMEYKMWKDEDNLQAEFESLIEKHKNDIKIANCLSSYYIEELHFLRTLIEEKTLEYVETSEKVELQINNQKSELKDLRRTFKQYQELKEEYRKKIQKVLTQQWQRQSNSVS